MRDGVLISLDCTGHLSAGAELIMRPVWQAHPSNSRAEARQAVMPGDPRRAASRYDTAASKAMRAAFSPIMIDGALVLPDVKVGMIEASATRRPAIPWTRS